MRVVFHTTTSIKLTTLRDALVNSTHKPKKASHRLSKRKMASSTMALYMNERYLISS
jgi:hypothetical protein